MSDSSIVRCGAAILAAADNPLVRRGVTRYGMRLGARRFVAGENIDGLLAGCT